MGGASNCIRSALLYVTRSRARARPRRLAPGNLQVFDATREECPDNERVFIEVVGMLMSNVLPASQSVK